MMRALTMTRKHKWTTFIEIIQIVIKGSYYVLVGQCERLLSGAGSINKGIERRLALSRRVNAATAVEHTGLPFHDKFIRSLVGRHIVKRLVPRFR